MKQRIRYTIKSFLGQHTLFPIQFKFDGVDQLSNLKDWKERKPDDERIIDLRSPKSSFNKTKRKRAKSKDSKAPQKSQRSALQKS